MKISICLCLFLLHFSVFSQTPKQVILYIGDGFGIAPKTAARMAMGQGTDNKRYFSDPDFQVLQLDKLRYTSMATTHSLNSWTTDSAPGATVYSTGKKIDNEVIAFDLESNLPLETILEKAKKQGYAVGLVTNTRITHATPASFGSHIWHRDLEDYIATQLISSTQAEYEQVFNTSPIDSLKYKVERDWELPKPKIGVEIDVLFGGGVGNFLPQGKFDTIVAENGKKIALAGKRIDQINLISIAKKRGYIHVNSKDGLSKIDVNKFSNSTKNKVLGLFKSSHMSYEQDRQLTNEWEPSLSDMTQKAIEILKKKGGSKGFFLMVEGGRIDHLGHANAGAVSKACRQETDSIAFPPDGGNQRLKNTAQGNIYGSDYLIKEVLGFDYAIAEGRKLLNEKNTETLIFSTSDHECGAIAVIGLSNGKTGLRTYAEEPYQSQKNAATPKNIHRGDSPNGHFPQYSLYTFHNKLYPKPTSDSSNHIVITYASNPGVLGGCGGNHTPQDIWVGADDNVNGKYASQITGKGMLDNTSLFPIMINFMGLK
jgi:alkaline phosphatase